MGKAGARLQIGVLQIGVDEVHFCTMSASWLSISPACGRKQFPSKISTMRFRVDTCVEGNTPETSQSQKRTEFSKGLGETWGYTHKWGRHFPHLCGNQFLPKSQKPQVYHKAINPDMKSHTRLLWCGFGGSAAVADYIISSVPHTVFFFA